MFQRLDALLPIRYSFMAVCAFSVLLSLFSLAFFSVGWLALIASVALVGVGVHDLRQTRHAVLRNYPVIGHMRFLLEFIRPEMRQYFIESDSEATPFSRAQRSLVYQRAKGEPDNQPFGTHLDVGSQGYEWVNHSMAPTRLPTHDFRIWIGGTPPGTINIDGAMHAALQRQRFQYFGAEFWLALCQRDSGPEQRGKTGWLCT